MSSEFERLGAHLMRFGPKKFQSLLSILKQSGGASYLRSAAAFTPQASTISVVKEMIEDDQRQIRAFLDTPEASALAGRERSRQAATATRHRKPRKRKRGGYRGPIVDQEQQQQWGL